MVAVFGLFATLSLIMMQQMGFGLAVAVLIDATIVRAVLAAVGDEAAGRVELVPADVARVAAEPLSPEGPADEPAPEAAPALMPELKCGGAYLERPLPVAPVWSGP